MIEYRDLEYNYSINDTNWQSQTITAEMEIEMREFQNIIVSNITTIVGWGCVGVMCDSTQISGFGLEEWTGGEVEIEDASVTIYLCFKKISENNLRYDSVDKYFYFEDGVFPQTAVVTLENGVTLKTKLNSLSYTTIDVDSWALQKLLF